MLANQKKEGGMELLEMLNNSLNELRGSLKGGLYEGQI